MATAAYAHGDAWVDALSRYLAGNAAIFVDGLAAIPGLRPMPLDATYLAWVDFAGTGMTPRGVHRAGREATPASPRATAPPSAPAARASCASTSPPRAPGSRKPSAACRRAFADLQ